MRELGEITLATEDAAQLARATHTACGAGNVVESERLIVQFLHAMPPAMQHDLIRALKGLLHHATTFAVGDGMRGDDLLRREGLDARGVEQLLQRAELMAQIGSGWRLRSANGFVGRTRQRNLKPVSKSCDEFVTHDALALAGAGVFHGAQVHAHGLKSLP